MKNVEYNISGIKCDNCNYYKDDVKYEEYIHYINKPCPECGFNLLTQDDYDKCNTLVNTLDQINKMSLEQLNLAADLSNSKEIMKKLGFENIPKDDIIEMRIDLKDFNININKQLQQNDWDHMYDCIFDIIQKKSTKEELIDIFNMLPIYMKNDAYTYGMSDTVWRDKFIEWYKTNKL